MIVSQQVIDILLEAEEHTKRLRAEALENDVDVARLPLVRGDDLMKEGLE